MGDCDYARASTRSSRAFADAYGLAAGRDVTLAPLESVRIYDVLDTAMARLIDELQGLRLDRDMDRVNRSYISPTRSSAAASRRCARPRARVTRSRPLPSPRPAKTWPRAVGDSEGQWGRAEEVAAVPVRGGGRALTPSPSPAVAGEGVRSCDRAGHPRSLPWPLRSSSPVPIVFPLARHPGAAAPGVPWKGVRG